MKGLCEMLISMIQLTIPGITKLKKDLRTLKKQRTLEALRTITDEVDAEDASDSGDWDSPLMGDNAISQAKARGKTVVSKSYAKNRNKGENLKKKRKIASSTSSPTPLYTFPLEDELLSPDNSSLTSSMAQLSSVFSDSFFAVNYDDFTRTCKVVSTLCDAPSLSHKSLRGSALALTPEFQFALGSLVRTLEA
ncbi:uncharacterized protein LOC113329458 isoform X2 [Papaver somniferum]|uniref:uncharacterized protein LOC113329458 isoform X2 n=1 Tax=Papaver somniferum TaxID=3469 RepID=UPI000E70459A|nr:uncharacterized protein LOC113329458 isoform X2 [Papaver somniferum]XP_026432116.1 uncharacterized protein LOC113329458 isoform X2 [Papaver somniferum]